MRRTVLLLMALLLATGAIAGFKVKLIKAKKPEQFQNHVMIADVIWAADLLADGKDQRDFFYKELTPSNVVAVRLSVFNRSRGSIVLPVDAIELRDAGGKELSRVEPVAVAEAVLQGKVVTPGDTEEAPLATVRPVMRDPRYDPNDPRYDPRLDPNDPRYDPNDPSLPPSSRRRYPGGYPTPGIDVILNPGGGGGGGGDLSRYEKSLVEKDFGDKAHSEDPVEAGRTRDRFLYFAVPGKPGDTRGYSLRIPAGKGIPSDVVITF